MYRYCIRRKVLLTGIIAIIFLLLIIVTFRNYGVLSQQTGRSASNTATPTRHQTYQFQLDTFPRERVWHLGQDKVFRWIPKPMALSDAPTPGKVVLIVNLYGPFLTFQDADQQITRWFNTPPGSVMLPAPTLTSALRMTNGWSNQPQQTMVSLPATLAPGYYVWYAQVTTEQDYSGGTALTVQITPL